MTIILDNYPPLAPSRGSDQGAVRIQDLLSERIIVISAPPRIIGVPKTVLLVNRALVPPEKGGFDENGENDESAF